jgi:hypothetical protein
MLEQPMQRHMPAGLLVSNLEQGSRLLSHVRFTAMIAYAFQFSAFGGAEG